VGQIQRKLAEIRDAIDDQRFEKLKEISQSDYDARISAYDSYLADHPSGKRRQKVESIISDAVEEYCTFLKNEIRAGSCNSIDSLIYEKHKHHILSVLKHSMIADEKNEIRRLLEKGKNELKKNNYGKASEYFEQSLAIVQRSRLKDFQAYRYYESEILSALNNENITYFKKGYLQFKGKWYSSQEYEEILQEHEHVKYEGEWHSPAEYEELMIERGFYKYDNEYFTQVKFIEQVIKPALRSKCAIQE
ncbi:MAG: hypothetical protein SV775_16435, partial [Thermodesulfobacteriota bacterium]|nr:hypothetical protein [Thermodesulfobacteriota bacterium]